MAEAQPMTEAMFYVLLSLVQPGHGYGMMQRIKELSNERINMGPGTLYGVMTRMRNDGWIKQIRPKGEDSRRKTYVLTPLGKTELINEYTRLQALVKDGSFLGEGEINNEETQ